MAAVNDEPPVVRDQIEVDSLSVACDGDAGALGHPRVFLAIDPSTGDTECPYCSRRFIYRPTGGEPLTKPQAARDAKPSAT